MRAGILLANQDSTMNQPIRHSAGFAFKRRVERVDWRLLASVDVDRITRDLDFGALQQNLLHVTFCNVDSEIDPRMTDPNLIKLLKVSQLISEYLLHSQEYLTETINFLELKASKLQQANDSLNEKIDKQQLEIQDLKAERKKNKAFIKELQAKVANGAHSYFKCAFCPKSFMSDYYLQNHIQRRHPDAASRNDSSDKLTEMERAMAEMRERLHTTELSLERAKSESFFREQVELLKTTTLANVSEGQAETMSQRMMQQMNELQNKYAESQLALANALANQKRESPRRDANMARMEEQLRRLEVENESKRILLERLQYKQEADRRSSPERTPTKKVAQPPRHQSTPKQPTPQQQETRRRHSEEELVSPIQQIVHQDEPDLAEESEDSTESDVQIPFTYSKDDRLLNQLRMDPRLLEKLRPELHDMLAAELEKLGVHAGQKGLTKKALAAKLTRLEQERKQFEAKTPGLRKLKEEYEKDVSDLAAKNLATYGPYARFKQPSTAYALSTSMIAEKKGAAKRTLNFSQGSLISNPSLRDRQPPPSPKASSTARLSPEPSAPPVARPRVAKQDSPKRESPRREQPTAPKRDSKKYPVHNDGLVDPRASSGLVATSTLLDDSDEGDDNWDSISDLQDMTPGPARQQPPPRQTSFNSTNGVQAAAKNIESELRQSKSKPKPAGAVDVSGVNTIGDSDSEPFSDDDFSKSNISALVDGPKNQPTPVLTSTIKPSDKNPTQSGATHKESLVSITSFDSELLSDFDS